MLNTTRAGDRAVKAFQARHGLPYMEARRAHAALAHTLADPAPTDTAAALRACIEAFAAFTDLDRADFGRLPDRPVRFAEHFERGLELARDALAALDAGDVQSAAERMSDGGRHLTYAHRFLERAANRYQRETARFMAVARQASAATTGRCLLGLGAARNCTGAARVRLVIWYPGDLRPHPSESGCVGHTAAARDTYDLRVVDVQVEGIDQEAVREVYRLGREHDRHRLGSYGDFGNVACGHPMARFCPGCGTCQTCDACYCKESEEA